MAELGIKRIEEKICRLQAEAEQLRSEVAVIDGQIQKRQNEVTGGTCLLTANRITSGLSSKS